MSPVEIGLILLSAGAHVYWNYELKRSPRPAQCAWLVMACGALIGLPLIFLHGPPSPPPTAGWLCAIGTGAVYALYFILIARSYRSEDLSRAYPIARGVAPLATALFAWVAHAERPTPVGWAGIVAVSLGVFLLSGPELLRGAATLSWGGVLAAVGTGLCTAAYSIIDKAGVTLVTPSTYIVLTFAVGAVVQLALMALGPGPAGAGEAGVRGEIAREAARMGPRLALPALASLGGYLVVLLVMRDAPVAYVVPVRSTSVLMSVLAGWRLLGESAASGRLAAAAFILGGVSLIALYG